MLVKIEWLLIYFVSLNSGYYKRLCIVYKYEKFIFSSLNAECQDIFIIMGFWWIAISWLKEALLARTAYEEERGQWPPQASSWRPCLTENCGFSVIMAYSATKAFLPSSSQWGWGLDAWVVSRPKHSDINVFLLPKFSNLWHSSLFRLCWSKDSDECMQQRHTTLTEDFMTQSTPCLTPGFYKHLE